MGARDGHAFGHTDVGHAGHGHHGHETDGESAFWAVVLSFRFWTFAALGFGMSGSLIHLFKLAGPVATALIAGGAGLASGLFAALAFRALSRGSSSTVT